MTFAEVKKDILGKSTESGKKTFSESTFNTLTSAMLNEVNYEAEVSKRSGDGTVTTEVIKPVKEFRERIIGGIAKAAGVDKDEQEKLVNDYQFDSNTNWYPVMSEAIKNSLEAGKSFTFITKNDLECTLTMHEVDESIKMVGAPGASEKDKKPVLYGKHRTIKASSGCPRHLRKDQ